MAINSLVDDIEALKEELAEMRTISPRTDTPTPIPFPPTTKKAPESTVAPTQLPLPTPFVLQPPATWATVAKMDGKRNQNPQAKPAQAAAKPHAAKPAAKKVLPRGNADFTSSEK